MLYALDISRGVSCTMFGRMMQKNGWESTQKRSIARNLMVFVIDGQAEFDVADAHYHVSAGDILIIPANTPYLGYTADCCEYYFFHFTGLISPCSTPNIPRDLRREFTFTLSPAVYDKVYFPLKIATREDYNKIYNCIISCTEHNAHGTMAGRLILDMEFLKIMLLLGEVTEFENRSNNYPPALDKMIVFIKKNLTKPITLSDLCTHCRISSSYAERLFKRHLNTTVTEYINSEKLYYACELMRSTGMNISEIAAYLGYCDVFYFSKRFKRKFGKSPSKMFRTEK
ncbi:MAG: AraC family transcriptional regulator [Clostridia bacterium]|nr:AraC family transcriptional regulator [Clostridia bacterium]